MTTFQSLFPTIAELMQYAPGVETSNSVDDYAPSGAIAIKKITSIIPTSLLDKISTPSTEEEATPAPSSSSESATVPGSFAAGQSPLLSALKQAVANATLAQHLVFDSVRRRKSGTDVYKYEIEAMRRSYTESYLAAMDTLLSLLADDEDFLSSRFGKLLSSCQIKTCEQMDTIYPIDLSYLFFYRTLPLQRESLSERLAPYYQKLTPSSEEEATVPGSFAAGQSPHLATLDLALVKSTIAKALRRFDIMELPATMRNLLDDSTASRSGKDERTAALDLALQLEADVNTLLDSLDAVLSASTSPTYPNLQSPTTTYNDPSDLIYIMP